VSLFSHAGGLLQPDHFESGQLKVTVKRKRGTNPVAAHEGKRYAVHKGDALVRILAHPPKGLQLILAAGRFGTHENQSFPPYR
jgi:hypothetical protein